VDGCVCCVCVRVGGWVAGWLGGCVCVLCVCVDLCVSVIVYYESNLGRGERVRGL
jgi:hypothetical protein